MSCITLCPLTLTDCIFGLPSLKIFVHVFFFLFREHNIFLCIFLSSFLFILFYRYFFLLEVLSLMAVQGTAAPQSFSLLSHSSSLPLGSGGEQTCRDSMWSGQCLILEEANEYILHEFSLSLSSGPRTETSFFPIFLFFFFFFCYKPTPAGPPDELTSLLDSQSVNQGGGAGGRAYLQRSSCAASRCCGFLFLPLPW